jgi:signal recognition particle-docking protein FtsY
MGIFSKISSMFQKKRLDAATLDVLFETLLVADVPASLAVKLIEKLRSKFRPDSDTDIADIKNYLKDLLINDLKKLEEAPPRHASHDTPPLWGWDASVRVENIKQAPSHLTPVGGEYRPKGGEGGLLPKVILMIGANGAGKTTTIGKLVSQWVEAGKKVVVGACDTFRAAAGGQLAEWAARGGAELVCGNTNDPAAAAYAAVDSAIKTGADIVILDTAGRLHNRSDLMDELAKIIRVIKKLDESAPHEVWLVLDSTFGQNALAQIEYFDKTAALTGLILTKTDSTSRGGFLVGYAADTKNPLPVVAIGTGEKSADLSAFSASEYLNRLLDI